MHLCFLKDIQRHFYTGGSQRPDLTEKISQSFNGSPVYSQNNITGFNARFFSGPSGRYPNDENTTMGLVGMNSQPGLLRFR